MSMSYEEDIETIIKEELGDLDDIESFDDDDFFFEE